MKRPIHAFNETLSGSKTGSLQSLTTQLSHLDKLTQLALPMLPPGENWQVVAFSQGTLCIAAEHFAAMSQLRYLQANYVKQLQSIAEFAGIHKIKVIIENKPAPKLAPSVPRPELSDTSRQAINAAAALIQDAEISQALQRLASKE